MKLDEREAVLLALCCWIAGRWTSASSLIWPERVEEAMERVVLFSTPPAPALPPFPAASAFRVEFTSMLVPNFLRVAAAAPPAP